MIEVTGLRRISGIFPWIKKYAARADFCQTSRRGATHAAGRLPGNAPARPRQSEWSRRLVREHHVTTADLIWPLFVVDGENRVRPSRRCRASSGCRSISLLRQRKRQHAFPFRPSRSFPIPTCRCADDQASEAINPDNLICRTSAPSKPPCGYRHHLRRGAGPIHLPRHDGVFVA